MKKCTNMNYSLKSVSAVHFFSVFLYLFLRNALQHRLLRDKDATKI